MEKISIEHPYGRNLDPDARALRDEYAPDVPIRLTWVLTTGEKVSSDQPLDAIERGALVVLLERAKHHSGDVEVQLHQGAHVGRSPRRYVPLSEVAWIHLEVGE